MPTKDPPVLAPAVDQRARVQSLKRREFVGFLAGVTVSVPLVSALGWLSDRSRNELRLMISPGSSLPRIDFTNLPHSSQVVDERPRLIFAIPAEYRQRYRLGTVLGEYLNHGSDEFLAPLALVYVECIAESDLELPAAASGVGPFAALLVARETTRLIRFDLPDFGVIRFRSNSDANRYIKQRIATMAVVVRTAIFQTGSLEGESSSPVDTLWPGALSHPRVREMAEQARQGARIRPANGDSLIPGQDGSGAEEMTLAPSEIERHAPGLFAVALQAEGETRGDLMGMLAELVRERLVRGSVSGAEWARTAGCGVTIEGRESKSVIGCSMGFVPERSQRFLHFYVPAQNATRSSDRAKRPGGRQFGR